MVPFPNPFKKPAVETLCAVVGSDPCAEVADEDTAFTHDVVAPVPGSEDPDTTRRQRKALERWRELAGNDARAAVRRTAGGVETVLAADGSVIGDAVDEAELLAAIKGTRPFRHASAFAREEAKAAACEAEQAYNRRVAAIEQIAALAPTPRDASWYEASIAETQGWTADTEPFAEPEPSLDAIAAELGEEARRAVNPLAFWKTTQLREEYVASRARDRIAAARRAWGERRDAWVAAQGEKVAALEAAREEAVAQLRAALDGDPAYVREGVVRRLDEMGLPLEVSVEVGFSAPELQVSLDLSGKGGIPERQLVTLKSGWLRVKPSGARRKLGKEAARDLAWVVAAVGFDVSPAVRRVSVTATLDGKTLVTEEIVPTDLTAEEGTTAES
ncbi:hypothetical protein [Caniella muris]|uniref:hypothetical protein n=1 Tax=Caniella muris TaxID=2941502 RepID=UPI00203C0D11|nr:hypothetical protein [Caniella muris]